MITRRFAADDGIALDADLAPDAPADLLATVERVRGWGGSERAYRHFLARGLATSSTTDGDTVRTVAVLAGWRAGVTRLRSAALAKADTLDVAVYEAALGLSPGTGPGFLDAQRHDPCAHPTQGPLVGIVGGFRGLGGPWLLSPRDAVTTGPATVSVRTGEDWWDIEVDVFGAVITPSGAPTPSHPGTLHARTGASYYVWLMRGSG